MDAQTIGKRLRAARGEHNLQTVCNAVGCSISAMLMYESGHRIPRDDVKVKLSKFYGKSIEELFYSA